MMDFSRAPEKVLQEFELRNLVLSLALLLAVGIVFRSFEAVWSCFIGVFITLIHFQFLKRDGREIAAKARAGVSHNRILGGFLFKFYSRLLVTGLIVGFLFYYGLAKPLYLVLGLSVTVLNLYFLVLEIILKKSWQVLALGR